MKTSFKAARGHNYHVVHESKTGAAHKACWTVCGQYFERGERSNHQPTCPNCVRVDNPLMLPLSVRVFFEDVAATHRRRDAPRDKTMATLLDLDLVSVDVGTGLLLTRRGQILAEDLTAGAVPMTDVRGVVHARRAFGVSSRCNRATMPSHIDNESVPITNTVTLEGVKTMTVERYGKLREVNKDLVITCLECLGK